jgi:hypothetical protein
MQKFIRPTRIIKVDGQETAFLSYTVGNAGLLITVSGPEVLVLTDHEVTEFDGSALKLDGKGWNED